VYHERGRELDVLPGGVELTDLVLVEGSPVAGFSRVPARAQQLFYRGQRLGIPAEVSQRANRSDECVGITWPQCEGVVVERKGAIVVFGRKREVSDGQRQGRPVLPPFISAAEVPVRCVDVG